jgi:hypothetical protein
MQICITLGGKRSCFEVPEFLIPIHFPPRPLPDPRDYPQLFQDASVIASLQASLSHVSDAGVRGALQEGIHAATRALQARGGEHYVISNEAAHKA